MKTYKKFIAALTVLMVLFTLIPQAVFAAGFPKHENYVADEAGILSEDTIKLIKDTNKALAEDVKLTIAVCTVSSTNGEDIAEYASKLFTEWKLGEGILILIAKDDNNYHFVPSTGIEDILSNDEIAAIRDEYFEGDFSNGVYERAVMKVVNKLKNTLIAGVQAREAAEAAAKQEDAENAENTEKKGTTVGSVIVGFFKTILFIVLFLVILFVAVFVWAMFNDDVAALLQKFIFRRNQNRSRAPQNYYDERLYGNAAPRQSAARRRPNPNNPNNPNAPRPANYRQNGYPQQNPYGNGYPVQNPYGNGYGQQNPYGTQNGYQQQNTYGNGYSGQNPYGAQNGYQQQNPYGNGYQQQQGGYVGQQNNNYAGQNQYNRNAGSYSAGNIPQNDGEKTVQFNIPRRG